MKVRGTIKRVIYSLMALVVITLGILGGMYLTKEIKLNTIQKEAIAELENNKDNYASNTIVLENTSKSQAEQLAKKLNASLRINSQETFATLTLPEGLTVSDVYHNDDYKEYLSQFSLDLYASASDVDGTNEELVDEPLREPTRPNYYVSDDGYTCQTYLDYLNMQNVWDNYKGDGIKVAVIDTGIDTDHSEFSGKISEWSYNATTDKIVKDYALEDGSYDWSLIEDEQGHGTAVAGVIASSFDGVGTVGIAPNVTLVVIKCAADEDGQFYNTSDLVFGLYYAIEQDVDVVNMSFGSDSNPFAEAAALAVDSDIICVAAAGNDASSTLHYPAADTNVIGVGALAADSWELASYSNYGENTDIVAPGTVYTTKMGGGYRVIRGTSFASPITAAVLALYKQQNCYCEYDNVKEMLYASSYDLGDLGADYIFGYGALDVSALLLEERGTVTFNYLTDEIDETKQIFIRNHTLQNLPEPDRNYCIFDGWYYDIYCTEEVQWYSDIWNQDLTLYAKWANEDDGIPYTYVTLDDGTIEIRSYTGHRKYITIPDYIDGKVVSSIGDYCFQGNTKLRRVYLPKYLNNIGVYAFKNCNNLLSIAIPEGVTKIEEGAFYNCVRLSDVTFEGDAKVTYVGDTAFASTALRSFIIPKNVSYLNGSAFFGTRQMVKYTVEKGNDYFMVSDMISLK